MDDATPVVDAFADRGIFARLKRAEIAELVDVCEPVDVIVGQALWTFGDPKDAAYILVSGRVEITYRVQPDGRRNDQYSSPGDLLTLSSLVHRWDHGSAGNPLERTRLLRLGRSAFDRLFEAAHPAAFVLVDAIAADLVEEMREANRRLHRVFGHPAETLRMLRRRSSDDGRSPQ